MLFRMINGTRVKQYKFEPEDISLTINGADGNKGEIVIKSVTTEIAFTIDILSLVINRG